MFCPKCAAQNTDDAKFCRACGADISLVPQAMSGQLVLRLEERGDARGHMRRYKDRDAVTIERAVRSLFMGVAFVFIALAARTWAPGGHFWWFWLFLPAAGLLADGVSTYLRLREERSKAAPLSFASAQTTLPPPSRFADLPKANTGEIIQPPASVTESTTRHLETRVERIPKDS